MHVEDWEQIRLRPDDIWYMSSPLRRVKVLRMRKI